MDAFAAQVTSSGTAFMQQLSVAQGLTITTGGLLVQAGGLKVSDPSLVRVCRFPIFDTPRNVCCVLIVLMEL